MLGLYSQGRWSGTEDIADQQKHIGRFRYFAEKNKKQYGENRQ